MRHVIVGAGPAGVAAAEELRRRDRSAEIVMVGDEKGAPYARMALPYLLEGKIDETGTRIRRDPEHFPRLDVRLVHERVVRVDPERRKVSLGDGSDLDYDRLLIATGSRSAVPAVQGIDVPGVHRCWTIEDARGLMGAESDGRNAILLGAGFIGCTLLQALASRGLKLTVIEIARQILPRMLDATAAALVRRWCEQKGVRILSSTLVEGIRESKNGNGTSLWVQLEGSGELPASLAILTTGVRPNVEVLEGSGIRCNQGVLVDRHLRTSAPDVFAAGDVAEGPELFGGRSVHATQPTAAEHGRVAAVNMSGGDLPYQGSLIMNVLDTFGLTSCSLGSWQSGGDRIRALDEGRFRYLHMRLDGDRIVGAVSVGWEQGLGALRGLIQSRVRLGPWRDRLLRQPERFVEAYLARAAAAPCA
jgi:NAD(P)H-nitrite reductase large subunit